MTRKEAKAWLEHHFDPIPDGTKQSEAVSLAIKALEQEPCEDAISREMALKECHDIVIDGERYRVIQEETLLGLPPVTPQYTEDEIQKMQDLEQAEIEKAYELGKVEGQNSEDAISRQAVLDRIRESIETYHNQYTTDMLNMWGLFTQFIKEMPSVTPKPKTGHWKAKSFHELFCDNCGFDFDIMRNDFIDKMNYCPNCGVKMVEPQESEGIDADSD